MTFEFINNLIEKYFAGETSLDEERVLRGYFMGTDIDSRLHSYAPLFQFFENEKEIIFEDSKMPKFDDVKVVALGGNQKEVSKFEVLRGGAFWKVAAAIAFLVVSSFAVSHFLKPQKMEVAQQHHKAKVIILDEDDDPEVALKKVNEALALVSKKMKKGTDETSEGLHKLRNATDVLHTDN